MSDLPDDITAIFTPSEVAQYLRVDTSVVESLLNKGELRGFKVGNEWRVIGQDLISFLGQSLEKEQNAAITRNLTDPKFWAREICKHPEFRRAIENADPSPGTFSAFLKQGLEALQAESQAENVVEFPGKDRT